MHDTVLAFVARIVKTYGLADVSVLEVGSYNVNGSVRSLFNGPYVGVESTGAGVDRVVDGDYFYLKNSGRFDLAVSTETLEHDPRPWRTVANMATAVRSGGLVVFTVRGLTAWGCTDRHDYPGDYWRPSDQGVSVMLEDAGLEILEICEDPYRGMPGWFAVARKP